MAIPARLLRTLNDRLGREATESLADWMKQVDSSTADARRFREEMGRFREETRTSFARIDARFAELDAKMERRFAELLKWSFVFWVGAVGAIAALAGILRR